MLCSSAVAVQRKGFLLGTPWLLNLGVPAGQSVVAKSLGQLRTWAAVWLTAVHLCLACHLKYNVEKSARTSKPLLFYSEATQVNVTWGNKNENAHRYSFPWRQCPECHDCGLWYELPPHPSHVPQTQGRLHRRENWNEKTITKEHVYKNN